MLERIIKLPEATRHVFNYLSGNELLHDFTLIGGTALALQIGHRLSVDIDLWLAAERMDKNLIAEVVYSAQQHGFSALLATPDHQIIAAKINGMDLLAYSQDYVFDGVKVTFFARNDVAYRYFDAQQHLDNTNTSFRVMSAEGLFMMKSYVIHHRVRSRDLFDLKTMLMRGHVVEDIFRAGKAADSSYSVEYAKAVLLGNVPLDKEDEGFDAIGIKESIADIYIFFEKAINDYEQSIAQKLGTQF